MRGFPWAAGKCPFLKLQVRMAEGGVTPCCSDLQAALALGSRPLCILYLVSPSPEHPQPVATSPLPVASLRAEEDPALT